MKKANDVSNILPDVNFNWYKREEYARIKALVLKTFFNIGNEEAFKEFRMDSFDVRLAETFISKDSAFELRLFEFSVKTKCWKSDAKIWIVAGANIVGTTVLRIVGVSKPIIHDQTVDVIDWLHDSSNWHILNL